MNTRHSQNYFLKRVLSKKSTWLILLLHLLIIVFFAFIVVREKSWFWGRQWVDKIERIEEGGGVFSHKHIGYINPKINNVNNFFACVFPNLIILPLFIWTFFLNPLSWLWWGQFDDIGSETQKDGTDLFFLSTEIPTSRRRIFWRKIIFLTSFLVGLHLILFSLPLSFLLWKSNYFSNFTGLQIFLFLAMNFLVIPLLLLVPLTIFLFSLASCNSVWYNILKWVGRLSIFFIILLWFLVIRGLHEGGEIGKKLLEWGQNFSKWLSQHYLLTTLTIVGIIIFLALFTLSLAYKDFQKKDLQ